MVHVAVNKYDFEKINILEYAFGEGGGCHQKAYAVYAFINVDNCERPLTWHAIRVTLLLWILTVGYPRRTVLFKRCVLTWRRNYFGGRGSLLTDALLGLPKIA